VFDLDRVTPEDIMVDAALVADVPVDPCIGSQLVQLCVTASIDGLLGVSASSTLDLSTDLSSECLPYTFMGIDPEACVIAARDIVIDGGVRAVGKRALVLIGFSSITINGTVDVSSARGSSGKGAGSGPGECSLVPSAAGRGGGAGGTFGGRGGLGGGGAGVGGQPGSAAIANRLRGGCPGGGGSGTAGSALSNYGGGSVYLLSHGKITIAGTVNASGAGGFAGGPTASDGGDGAGSGGMIGLEAPEVITTTGSAVFANGGGGGQGVGSEVSQTGCHGQESSAPQDPASGGACPHTGGIGGAGSAGFALDGVSGDLALSGGAAHGGGGGGAGIIVVVPPQPLALASPPPS
jgi:hypothetical protein